MLAYLYNPIVCLSKVSNSHIFIVPEANLIPLLTFERVYFAKFHFHQSIFPRNTGLGTDIFTKLGYMACSLVKIKSIPDWHLFISRMETKWTKWYAMTSHVIAYRSLELLFGMHTFHFNCFLRDFNCVFTQIRCLSRVLEHSNAFISGWIFIILAGIKDNYKSFNEFDFRPHLTGNYS